MVREFQAVIDAIEADEHVRVVVFDSAVDDYFLNHSDFQARLEDLTSMPAGPTGLPPWPDFLVRLTRAPVASIALIRGRATGNGSELTLACDMSFASREKAIISQWEVGVGMVAGGGPMARLPHLIGRNRALEVLLSSEISAENRPKPTAMSIAPCLTPSWTPSSRRLQPASHGSTNGRSRNQASGKHYSATGRRDRCRMGRLHCFPGTARGPERNQSAERAGFHKPGMLRTALDIT